MKRRKTSSAHVTALIGAVLLCTGTVWALDGLRIISLPFFQLLNSFFALWPLVLIVIGLCMLFRSRIVAVALGFIYFAVILLNALGTFGTVNPNYLWYQNLTGEAAIYEEVSSSEHSEISLSPDITSSTMVLSAGTPRQIVMEPQNGPDLFDIKTDAPHYTINNYISDIDSSRMIFDVNTTFSAPDEVLLTLNEAVQWDVQIRSGASNIHLNFDKLNVAAVDIECGAAKIDARLSSLSPAIVPVHVNSGFSDIQFHLPKDSGYQITSSSAATSITAGGKQLSGIGEKSYQSENFEIARQVFYFYISSGASNVTILQE